ncbi:response regulator transcription factor [Kineococcus rhizosphaerae]|uniref:LuxR family two component transcriptional regulator n=1 Tax=Kineococcus rhizosphaerae TaxID=559628 RepID=A0A2T0QYR5_9ACTN|nr:response regulator transcription factor [Kineococcus rhizosphaerae]PRY11522.1 LuxR family two component transcriptional regulator [Kineococcus rhizosphaerae]
MSRPVRLAIVDDHTLFRSALGQLLNAEDDIEVVGLAGDAQGALDLVKETSPDVLLLDVEFPGPGVVPTVQTLRRVAPRLHILMLSMYDSPTTIQELLGLGVRGYLLKSASDAELLAAIRRVVADPRQVVLSVTSKLFEAVPEHSSGNLSDREIEVLSLASLGLSNAQIGRRLDLRESTVKRHMHNVFVKLSAVSRIDAVNKASRAGLLRNPGH